MQQVLRQWMLITGLGLGLSQPVAAKFYTIIGPDGFPMVVYNQEHQAVSTEKKKQDVRPKAQVAAEQHKQNQPEVQAEKKALPQAQVSAQPAAIVQPAANQAAVLQQQQQNTAQAVLQQNEQAQQLKKLQLEKDQSEKLQQDKQQAEKLRLDKHQQKKQQAEKQQLEKQHAEQIQFEKQQYDAKAKSRVPSAQNEQTPAQKQQASALQAASSTAPTAQQAVRLPAADPTQRVNVEALFPKTPAREKIGIQDQTQKSDIQKQVKSEDPHYTVIDGVEYVSHEYLEDREFNLEGKKRFYVMPEFGNANAHRMQTVERERGITASILGGSSRKRQAPSSTLALSADYFRIEKADVEAALQQQCFEGEKLAKAKTLSSSNNELGFWPVAPLKERFVFEVAKLAPEVDTIQLQSYATRSKVEQFYWPMVVFLDQSGCVLEGVSGFKTENIAATAFRHASIQGLLKKPSQAAYLFMTPLSSAIDVDETKLTHQGQVQLRMLE